MATMGHLEYGRLTDAWRGEASDFTPLLVQRLDQLGEAIGVELASAGQSEVPTAGGRRIDIVAQTGDGSEFVIENQYNRADHDHLTRGLAYAVAREARGLVVVAEEHRDEFRTVAQYLNELAAMHDRERSVAVWLVEARAVRVDDSAWAPLFHTVVAPNHFAENVERTKRTERLGSLAEFLARVGSADARAVAEQVLQQWTEQGHPHRLGPNHVVLEARGPAANGIRSVVSLYEDGSVTVPFSSYAGVNSGIPVEALTTHEFRTRANTLFGFTGSERQAQTAAGWLTTDRAGALATFCFEVADAYTEANRADVSEPHELPG